VKGYVVEQFHDQPFVGVLKTFKLYKLPQSEQRNPRPVSAVSIDRINQAPPQRPPGKPAGKTRKGTYMKNHLLPLLFLVAAVCASSGAPSATPAAFVVESITQAEAKNHIGKSKTVCGVVASANYAARSRRQPTFLNLDEPYPRQIFTAVIWAEDRPKFGTPETTLKGKRVCVTGLIEEYRGVPQIVLRDVSQLNEKRD
jgi:hypothetical protein